MAGEECEFQDLRPEQVEQFQEQYLVLKTLIDTTEVLNIEQQVRKLSNMKKYSWVPKKIDAFIKFQEIEKKNNDEAIKEKSMEKKELSFFDSVVIDLELQTKKCLREEINIGLQYARLIGVVYQTCLKPDDVNERMLLIKEKHVLRRMINSYEERWRDLAPTISIKTQQNRATGKPEVNFCRKRFHTRQRKRMEERYMHAVQSYTQGHCAKENLPHSAHHTLPDADLFLVGYHREVSRVERQVARLQARDKLRDMHRRGLMCIDTDLLPRMQRIAITKEESMDKIENQLSTLDLNNKEDGQL